MSSELKVISICSYLTDVDIAWRPEDHTALKMVKAVKGDDFKGYFELTVGGIRKRLSNSNIKEFIELVPGARQRALKKEVSTKAVIVPIPNSHVTDPEQEYFRTFELARALAKISDSLFEAVPALVFREPQEKSREGGPRSPYHFESVYEIKKKVSGPIILLDDVVTGGGHLIGACWKLSSSTRKILLGCTFGASTKEQLPNPIASRSQILSLEKREYFESF
jgi:hypothetical protein